VIDQALINVPTRKFKLSMLEVCSKD
jgi:hypothetical protein